MGFVYLLHIFLYFAPYLFTSLTCFLCMTSPDIGLTFTEHHEAARHATEAAINSSTPNLVRAVDRASLATTAVATSSGDAATLTAKKRPSQGPRLLDSASLREVAPATVQALALRGSQGERSSGPTPSCPWTREGFKLPEFRRELENLAQEIQRASPLLTNLQLSNSKAGRHFSKVVLNRAMDFDLSQSLRRG